MLAKPCSRCGRSLPLSFFQARHDRRDEWGRLLWSSWHRRQSWCAQCMNAYNRARAATPAGRRRQRLSSLLRRLERRYGIKHTRLRSERLLACAAVALVNVASVAETRRGTPDQDQDGQVTIVDLVAVISGWGPCPPPCCRPDIDKNGAVDAKDVLVVLQWWQRYDPATYPWCQ